MAPPLNGTVTGTFPTGTTLLFDPTPDSITDGVTLVELTGINVGVDSTGAFSVSLVATNNPAYAPINWTYRVTGSTPNGNRMDFFISLAVGQTLNLAGAGAAIESDGLIVPYVSVVDTVTPANITSISSVLSSADGGGTIHLSAGVYTWDTAGDLADGTRLLGGPGVIIDLSDSSPDYPMLIQGTESAHTALGTNATAGAYTVTLPTGSGASFAIDDVIGLISDDVVAGSAGRARELHQVLGVVGDVVTLDAPLYFSYLTADSAAFFKQTPKKDITIEGITFQWNATDVVKWRGPLISRAIRCHFKDITVVNGPGITLDDAINCSITNTTIDGSKEYATVYLAGSYGITVSGSGHGVVVDGGTFRATRHATTTLYYEDGSGNLWTGPFDTIFSNLVGWGGSESFAVFDTHSYAHDTLYSNCKAIGPGQAATPCFQDRAVRTKIQSCSARGANRGITLTTDSTDCTISDCDVRDINTSASPAGILVSGPGARVIGNRLKNCTTGINIGSTGTNVLIEDNEFAGLMSTAGISDGAGADIGQVARDNLFRIDTSEVAIAFNGWRGWAYDNIFIGSVGFPFFTTTNARMTKSIDHPTTVTYAASVTPQPTLINCLSITLTGNIAIANPNTSNTVKGCTFRLILIQDGVGGRTTTFGTAYKEQWTPDTTAGRINVIDFQFDGTDWVQTASAVNLQ